MPGRYHPRVTQTSASRSAEGYAFRRPTVTVASMAKPQVTRPRRLKSSPSGRTIGVGMGLGRRQVAVQWGRTFQ